RRPVLFALSGPPGRFYQEGSELEKVAHDRDHFADSARSRRRVPFCPRLRTVPEVRKCFKRVRAALRLVREDLGDDAYREENWCLRDAARPLTEVRDAEMLVE